MFGANRQSDLSGIRHQHCRLYQASPESRSLVWPSRKSARRQCVCQLWTQNGVNQLGTSQLKQISGLHVILISTTRWNCRFSGIKPTGLRDVGWIKIDSNHFTDGEPALTWHTIESLKLSDFDHATFKRSGTLSNTR